MSTTQLRDEAILTSHRKFHILGYTSLRTLPTPKKTRSNAKTPLGPLQHNMMKGRSPFAVHRRLEVKNM
jgi:hypothetical protein